MIKKTKGDKMIYTSYFAKLSQVKNPLSISIGSPKWYTGSKLLMLAPSWELVRDYKDGRIGIDEYTVVYKKEILSALPPKELYAYIESKFPEGEDITLLCYEKPSEFCHRHIVAEWFTNAGFPVTEMVFK
jgi:uncharacterized protein YeaO (DUF488 family)